jgi:hypothetical protein
MGRGNLFWHKTSNGTRTAGLTTRPDMVTKSLLNGRFAIMMDELPTVLLAPVHVSYLMRVAEDAQTPWPGVIAELNEEISSQALTSQMEKVIKRELRETYKNGTILFWKPPRWAA